MTAIRERIVTAFDRAFDYDAHATVQRRTAAALARQIADLPLPPSPRVLEFGCGTGFLAAATPESLAGANWLMTDIAPDMVARSRRRFGRQGSYRFAVLDAEDPHFPSGEDCFDLVCSNLTVQWFDDLPGSIERLFALVRPDGWLLFSTLAAGTFAEWEGAHSALGLRSGMRLLTDLAALAALRPLGIAGTVTAERFAEAHADARAFLRSVRAIGAGTPHPWHRPLAVPAMRAVMRRFEEDGARASYVIATCLFHRPPERSA